VVFFGYTDPELAKKAPLVFTWDVDKTYLDTNITTLAGLIRTIREKAFQKKNIPGTATLIRALKEIYAQNSENLPLYFITASPPQMEMKIKAKLSLDGISPYGAFFKDNLRNLKPSRFRRLTQQIGFKLQALIQLRMMLGSDVKQILWGDDTESDALVYSLYSDICAKRISSDELFRLLESLNVQTHQIKNILTMTDEMPAHDPVQRVYINLAVDTDPDYYIKFGRRMLPTYNTFQVAMDLFQEGRIQSKTLLSIATVLISIYNFSKEEIFWSIEDMIQRSVLKKETIEQIMKLLEENGILLSHFRFTQKTKGIMEKPLEDLEWVPTKIDYLNDYR
jgi:hypothetical protein